jgi:hypothetical protein
MNWSRIILIRAGIFWLAATALTDAALARSDVLWGVNGHPFQSYPGVTIPQQLDYLEDLGLKSYRVDVGSLDRASGLRYLVSEAEKRGIEVLPVLTPALNLEKETERGLYDKSFAFASLLVAQFKDKIRVWELGNELENFAILQPCEMQDDGVQYNCSWGPATGIGELEYYGPRWKKVSAVLKGLSDGAASADPTIRIAMGTAGWGHVGAFHRMKRDGIRWDISVWHLYGDDPEWAFKILADLKKPIWVTEFNHPVGSKVSEEDQAVGLAKWMERLRDLSPKYDVEAAHIYQLMDESYWAPDDAAVLGLVKLESNGSGGWRRGPVKASYEKVREVARGHVEFGIRPDYQGINSVVSALRARCRLQPLTDKSATEQQRIEYSFCLLLGRRPDGGGLVSWTNELKTGRSVTEVLLSIMNSEEFQSAASKVGSRPQDYVVFLYRLLLDREPDLGSLNAYTSMIVRDAVSPGDIGKMLVTSDEFRDKHLSLFAGG